MSCIHQAYDLGAAPARYLRFGKKENSLAVGMFKTAVALTLLVPGILLALSSFALNLLLSPCCGSQFKGRIANQSENLQEPRGKTIEERRRESAILGHANFNKNEWKDWGTALLKLEESIRAFREVELRVVIFFQHRPEPGPGIEDPFDRYSSDIYLEPLPVPNVPIVTRNRYFAFPECLKQKLLEITNLGKNFEKERQTRCDIVRSINKDKETFMGLLDQSVAVYSKTVDIFSRNYNQDALNDLNSLHQDYCRELAHVYDALKTLYHIEGNTPLCVSLSERQNEIKEWASSLALLLSK